MERIDPLERPLKYRPQAVASSSLGGFEMRTTRIQDLAVVLFLVAVLGVLLILSIAFGKPGVA
jgi:hypothetical protein